MYIRERERVFKGLLFINSFFTFHICLTENDGVWGIGLWEMMKKVFWGYDMRFFDSIG